MLNHQYKFLFIHIGKTGGTSIEKLFIPEANINFNSVANKHHTLERYSKEFPNETANYFKFTFMRNPFDWLVSRYFWSRSQGLIINYTFPEFITRIITDKNWWDAGPDYLWKRVAVAPQISNITINNEVAVDFIGRFEYLQHDFDLICDYCGMPKQQLAHTLKTEHKPYLQYYTKAMLQDVYDKYKCDFNTIAAYSLQAKELGLC